jgi:dCTP deaminase
MEIPLRINKGSRTPVLAEGGEEMVILSDAGLREAFDKKDITITPLPSKLEPASVDLSVGEEAFAASANEITKLSDGKLLTIPAGEMVLIITKEQIQLSAKIVGHIGLRSYFTRKGLVLLAGPQIDPGFEGKLHIVLCNLSPVEITLAYGEPFCTVEFFALDKPAQNIYSGSYQKQMGISPREIDDIKQRRGYALSEVMKDMRVIAQDIGELKGVVKFHAEKIDAYVNNANKNMTIFVSTIVALAIFTIGTLVTIAIKFMK